MDKLTLVKIKNPFNREDRDIVPVEYRCGVTLLELRNEHFPQDVQVVVSLNGEVIPSPDLAFTIPTAGDQILFIPQVHGGDDGDGIFRVVLMIAVAALATYMFGPAGAVYANSWLGYAAVMVVGGMLVNALLPPTKPKLPGDLEQSQTYSWNPQTTQQQGVAIPKFYGVNKLYGNIIGAYLENIGDQSTVNALVGLGMGPMKRFYEFKINDQNVDFFQGIQISEQRGLLSQDAALPFQKTKLEYPVWVKIDHATPYIYESVGSSFDGLEIEISFPKGIWAMKNDGSLYDNWISVGIDFRKSGSSDPWVPLLHQLASESIGQWYVTEDRWSIGYWSGLVVNNEPIWLEVSDPTTTNPYAHTEGEVLYNVDFYGAVYYHWVKRGTRLWRREWLDYGSDILDFRTFGGSSTKPLRYTFKTPDVPLTAGAYEIRVTKFSSDMIGNYGDDLYLSSIREVVFDSFSYPRLALVGIKALATDQLSGSLRFSCMAECSYVRYWNGSAWVYDASDNPAWCAWDCFTMPVIDAVKSSALLPGYEYYSSETGMSFRIIRYDGMDPSGLDLVAFKAWADFCDELVPDGKGGTEKRITFNGGFDTTTSKWEAAMQICAVGRAIPVWNGTHITVAVDKPGTPVQMFTVGNIGRDSFRETFLKQADRASSLTMDFVNREKGYTRDTFTVDLPDIPGTNSASIPMLGVTKPAEAWRAGMYRLYNNLYIKRMAEIDVGIDAIACTIGDLVYVQHDVPQWGFGGRLAAASSTTVTLDREVVIEAGKSYTVMVRLMDDSLASRAVTNAPGTYTELTVSTPFSSVPAQYDPYAFGETTKVVKPFRVMGISRKDDLECTLSLVEYNESIYGADSGQPVLPAENYSSLDALPPVTGLLLDELLISRQDGGIEDVIDVYFTPPASEYYREAEIWFDNGGGWTFAGSTISGRFRIPAVQVGLTYTVAVVTVNVAGGRAKIQNAPQAAIDTLGKLDPPSNVTNFAAMQNGQFVNFSWTHIPDADLWGYELRQGSAWEGARVIASGISADQYSWQAELNGTYRFLIKAIDSSGLYSTTEASVVITLTRIDENINVIISQDEITKVGGPDGTKTNFVFMDGATKYLTMPHMLLDTDVPSWTDVTAEITGYTGGITLSAEYVTLSIDTLKIGETWTRILDAFDAFDRGAMDTSYPDRTDQSYPADTDTHITMPVTKSIWLSYSTDGSAWSAWEQYFGTVQHSLRYVKIKHDVAVTSTTGVFRLLNLLMKLDVPDVILTIPDFAVTAGTGDDLLFSTYSTQFYSTPVVTATLIGGAVNKVPVVSSKSATGFHIDLRDKTDASVAGTVDIRVSGY